MRDISKQLNQVWQFHQAFKIDQSEEMRLGTQSKRKLRLKLFAEELGEFTLATYHNNKLEQLDGVIDMIYILCGTVNYHGLGLMFQDFLNGEHDVTNRPLESYPVAFGLALKTNNAEAKYLHGSITYSELLQMLVELMSLCLKLYNRLEKDNIVKSNCFEAVFNEVHNSNMSKLDKQGNPIYREDGKVLKSDQYFKPNLKQFINQ